MLADDLGTVMVLVPSLFVYFEVGGFGDGEAAVCDAGWRLLLAGIADGWERVWIERL